MEKQLQDPSTIRLTAPAVSEVENKIAFRRAKVRELMRMGYGTQQITIVFKNGVKLATGEVITLPSSESAIRNDIEAILQEEAAAESDIDIPSKKADLRDKLRYLYNQAIREYRGEGTKSLAKNAYLNTALSVLKQLIDLEGLTSIKIEASPMEKEKRISGLAEEVNSLDKKEKDAIIGAIDQILGKDKQQEGLGESEVHDTTPRIPA